MEEFGLVEMKASEECLSRGVFRFRFPVGKEKRSWGAFTA